MQATRSPTRQISIRPIGLDQGTNEEPPFTVQFLADTFHFSSADAKVSTDMFGVNVRFNDDKKGVAVKFAADVEKRIGPHHAMYFDHNNTVKLYEWDKERFLKLAASPVEPEPEAPASSPPETLKKEEPVQKTLENYFELARSNSFVSDVRGLTKNLLHCFTLIQPDIRNVFDDYEPTNKSNEGRCRINSTFHLQSIQWSRHRLNTFVDFLLEIKAIPLLHKTYLNMNWDTFYKVLPEFDKPTLHYFVCLIYKLKDIPNATHWDLSNALHPPFLKNPYMS